MILNLGAIRMKDGTVRRSIQEQSGGAAVAAGERECCGARQNSWRQEYRVNFVGPTI